ncbi:unnamed protein product [Staurois parvus]|uniref:Uncharacterized protein n=1 Tax=Staurois parvus TaxID=386267 RepID=A0ABN9BN09_9NEOB|nr:unnamed protein product [Staurois parvus]
MYTDHQGTDDQCALMISVAPTVPPVSVHQCLPVHINATYQCPSELPFSVTCQCHLSVVPVSATYQCASVPPIRAALQCPSVMPVNAHQCHLPVPPHQCHLSVPITAASLAHISEGEKSLIYKIL